MIEIYVNGEYATATIRYETCEEAVEAFENVFISDTGDVTAKLSNSVDQQC